MKTKDKLTSLFEYQEFVKDSDLIYMRNDAENFSEGVLTDNELECASGGAPQFNPPLIAIGMFITLQTANGNVSGTIADIKGDQVLIDKVGWVNKNSISQ